MEPWYERLINIFNGLLSRCYGIWAKSATLFVDGRDFAFRECRNSELTTLKSNIYIYGPLSIVSEETLFLIERKSSFLFQQIVISEFAK